MRGLSAVILVGCLVLRATTSAFALTSPSITDDVSNADVAEPMKLPPPASSPTVIQVQPPAQPAVQAKPTQSDNPLWGIPLKQLSNTRDRPIFSPSRRAPPPAVVGPPVAAVAPPPAKPKEPERPQLSLLGTILNGNDGFGIFMDQATKAPVRIRMGTAYRGWTLRSMQKGAATLEKDQESVMLAFPKIANDPQDGVARLRAGTNAKLLSIGQAGFTGQLPTPDAAPLPVAFPPPGQPFGPRSR